MSLNRTKSLLQTMKTLKYGLQNNQLRVLAQYIAYYKRLQFIVYTFKTIADILEIENKTLIVDCIPNA